MSLVTLEFLKECSTEAMSLAHKLHDGIRDETMDRAMKTILKRLARLGTVANERKTKSLSTEEIEADGYERDP